MSTIGIACLIFLALALNNIYKIKVWSFVVGTVNGYVLPLIHDPSLGKARLAKDPPRGTELDVLVLDGSINQWPLLLVSVYLIP